MEDFYIAPLAVFAAAASIETLSHRADSTQWRPTFQYIATARVCLAALTRLQSLVLSGLDDRERLPDCSDLLAGLPSTRLTHLCVSADTASAEIMDQLAEFQD